MSSAVTEAATWETSVIGPDGTDLISAAGVRTGLQDVANRTKWLKESFVVASSKTLDMSGNDYPDGTSYATVSDPALVSASFTVTVAIGDVVQLHAGGSITFTLATASQYNFRWYDGTTDLAETFYDKGAAWTIGESFPVALTAVYIATSAGAVTFSFQGKRTGTSPTAQGGALRVGYTHFKLGT